MHSLRFIKEGNTMQPNQMIQHEASNPLAPLDTAKWRSIIADWEKTNENQKAYCERMNINLNTFTYMRGKLLAEKKKQSGADFVAVKIKPDAKPMTAPKIMTIENHKGIKIHLPIHISEVQLKQLLQLLGW